MGTIKLAQVSDTHGLDLEAAVRAANNAETDYFIHCGDIMPENYSHFLGDSKKNLEEGIEKRFQKRVQKRVEEDENFKKVMERSTFLQLIQNEHSEELLQDERFKEIIDEYLPQLKNDQKGFLEKVKEDSVLIKEEHSKIVKMFEPEQERIKKLEEKLANEYISFCDKLDTNLANFKGEAFGTWGNHDPWEIDYKGKKVNPMKNMKNINWVAGNIKLGNLNVLFAPETQEAVYGMKGEWFPHLRVPTKEALDNYVQKEMENGKSEKEIIEKVFSQYYKGFNLDLSITPQICFFHKGPGSLGGVAENFKKDNYSWGGIAEYIIQEFADDISYIGCGHHHGGFVGKEQGVIKIMNSGVNFPEMTGENDMYIQEVDEDTGKLVALERWVYKSKKKEENINLN